MDRPNLILWTCHDAGRAFGPYGDTSVPTPNLDRLAAEGTTFSRNFCTTPLCSPSRGSIQTGRYPHVNGLIGLVNQGWNLPAGETTLSRRLADDGYDTALCGFQHIVTPSETERLGFRLQPRCGGRAAGIATAVEELLAERALRDPFYLEINTFEAHRVWDDDDGSVAPSDVMVPPFWPDCDEVRQDLCGLYRHVRLIDQAVGRVVEAIDRAGLSERTLFVFTVDHGIPFPRCKSTLYDSGLATALIVRQPGVVPAGRRCDAMISNVDLCPTLLEAAGIEPPGNLDGRSFGEQLRGAGGAHRQWLFAEKSWHDDYDPMRCVRTERWKYLRNLQPGPRLTLPMDLCPSRCGTARALANSYLAERPAEELYDLHEDPHELSNLAGDATLETTLRDLRAILDDWMEETGDPFLADGRVDAPAKNYAASMRGQQWWPEAG